MKKSLKNSANLSFVMIVTVLILMGSIPASAYGASSVKVTLPSFQVTFNGQIIENSDRKYPLIVYKDITYFPMTYDDSRFLGVQADWTAEKGLIIVPFTAAAPYKSQIVNVKNNSTYNASIVEGKISVNGKAIDNKTEPYPLLSFRDVTYFPLTWRFANDEFKWSYSFSAAAGLTIDKSGAVSGGSTNIGNAGNGANNGTGTSSVTSQAAVTYGSTSDGKVLTVVSVPKVQAAQGNTGAAHRKTADISGSYVYYQGANGAVYQAPVPSPSTVKNVYTLPINLYDSDYALPTIKEENSRAVLRYNTGGASMGSDVEILLTPQGGAENFGLFDRGYTEAFGDTRYGTSDFNMGGKGNLHRQAAGESKPVRIGNPDLYYLYNMKDTAEYCIELYGDDLYTLANTDNGSSHYIYRVGLKTDETTRISDVDTKSFHIEGKYIYLLSAENKVQRMDLNGTNIQTLSITGGTPVDLDIQNGHIIYSLNDPSGNYLETTVLNPAGGIALNTKDRILGINIDGSGNMQYVKN